MQFFYKKVMKKTILFLFLFCNSIFAQEDSLKKYSVSELIKKMELNGDDNSSLYVQEILKKNTSDSIKAYAHLVKAIAIVNTSGDLDEAIKNDKIAMKYVANTNYIDLKTNISSTLALHYALKGEYKKALDFVAEIKKSKKSIANLYTTSLIYYVMGDFKKSNAISLQEISFVNHKLNDKYTTKEEITQLKGDKIGITLMLATVYSYQKKIDSAAYYINEAKKIFKENNKEIWFDGLWYHETFSFILRGQYDDALARMKKSEIFIANSKADTYQAEYYKALCWQAKEDNEKSLMHAETALQNKVPTISFLNYELELYNITAETSKKLGLTEKYNHYLRLYSETSQKINYQEKAEFISNLYNTDIVQPMEKALIENKQQSYNLYLGLTFTLILLIFFIFRFIASRKEKKKVQQTIERLLENEEKARKTQEIEKNTQQSIVKIETGVNELVEKKILKQLENFERKQQYLKLDITAGSLASDFNTNVVYLSKVIKKHKKNSFTNYINQLKIDYAVLQLKTDPAYKNYKITFWAEECGIPYSTFVRVFSQQTGTSPSKFIEYLNQRQ